MPNTNTLNTLITLIFSVICISLSAQNGVGVNTDSIAGQLHITNNSSVDFPQLRLTEVGNDYARIKFENTAFPDSYWDIAGRTGTDTTGSPLLNMYFNNGTEARDVFLMLGNGYLYRNSFGSKIRDYFFTDDTYRAGIGCDSVDFRVFTTPGANGKIRIGTKNRDNIVVDAKGNVGIGTSPDTLDGALQISISSHLTFPQLRLKDIGGAYSRIKFETTSYPNSFWDVAAATGTDSTGQKRYNVYYYQDGIGRDLFSLRGSGSLYRDSFEDYLYNYYFSKGSYLGGFGFSNQEMKIFTSSASTLVV